MEEKYHYTGLTDAQILESREEYGANVLTLPQREPLRRQFSEKFTDPLTIISLVAGGLSVDASCYEYFGLGQGAEAFFEPVSIFVAILLAMGLAFYFELQADKEFIILNQAHDDELAALVHSGNVTRVPRCGVVIDDIVVLDSGKEVPADCELLGAAMLQMNESIFTGEPFYNKSIHPEKSNQGAIYPTDHVMKGTKVMREHDIHKILAVGDRMEQGKMFETVQIEEGVKTPLSEQLDGLSNQIAWVSCGITAFIVIGRVVAYLVTNGTNIFGSVEQATPFFAYILQALVIAVMLIVVAVPEGLLVAVTLSLAYSMRYMLRANSLVRKMHTYETMGATIVICTDKTGVLTQNQMSVDGTKLYGDTPQDLLREGIAVNSTASLDPSDPANSRILDNPTEGALLLWLHSQGVDYRSLRGQAETVVEIPSFTKRKYMATLVGSTRLQGKRVLYIKGTPEIVFDPCVEPTANREELEQQSTEYQHRAIRTPGFTYQLVEEGDSVIESS